MCLRVKRFHISTAKKDIPCYKELNKDGTTPFVGCKFRETPEQKININWGIPFYTEVGIGFIHAYKENPNYKYKKKHGIEVERYNAYIPKGTKYWKGKHLLHFRENPEGYASKCIKLYNNK